LKWSTGNEGKLDIQGAWNNGQSHVLALLSQAVKQGIIEAAREVGSQNLSPSRRRLLEQVFALTGLAMALPQDELANADILERLSKALTKPTRIDQTTLTYLESVTRKKRHQFVQSEGADWYDLFCEASGHLNVITRFLEESQPSPTYTSLCILAGETALLVGDIFFNAGQNKTSEQYYALALEAAREARHAILQAVILGRMSFIPIYDGEPQKALPSIEQAQSLISQNTADVIPAWLWAIAGEAYANVGDAVASSEALAKAEWLINRGRSGNVSISFEEGAARAIFSPFRLLSYKGTCAIRLKHPEAAQESLRASLNQVDPTYLQHRSIALVDLGMTYVQQADIREACQYASQALSLVGQTGSGRVLQRAFTLRRELDPWKHTMFVKQLDEELTSLLNSERFRIIHEHK
jgi:tetratricopeptide (TPR) repeat protein